MLRSAPPGHPLQKPTVVQWDIGGMLSADGAADESVSPQSGIRSRHRPGPRVRVSPWPRFVRHEGLVRRRYVVAPNSPKTGTGARSLRLRTSTSPPRTGVTRGGSKNNLDRPSNRRDPPSRPPGLGPRVPRASPRGGVVASSATGATSSDLFLSVGGVFRFD